MNKTQKIKVLTEALRFYRRVGTRAVMNGKRLWVENGYIADEAMFKAGVSKRKLKKKEYLR
jgi:hypothetical protein